MLYKTSTLYTCKQLFKPFVVYVLFCVSYDLLKLPRLLKFSSSATARCWVRQPLQSPDTTGIWLFAECHILCRVFYFGHSAKSSLPSATQKTLGKRKHSAKKLFAECFIFDTRQRVSLPSVFFWHSAKGSLPSVTNTTLGKELFAECFFSNTRQRQFKNHILK